MQKRKWGKNMSELKQVKQELRANAMKDLEQATHILDDDSESGTESGSSDEESDKGEAVRDAQSPAQNVAKDVGISAGSLSSGSVERVQPSEAATTRSDATASTGAGEGRPLAVKSAPGAGDGRPLAVKSVCPAPPPSLLPPPENQRQSPTGMPLSLCPAASPPPRAAP